MNTGIQNSTDTYQDFIVRYYGNVRYLPFYMDITNVHYEDFITGITLTRDLPVIELEPEPEYTPVFPKEIEEITIFKQKEQTLLDTTLQYYGDPSKVIQNLIESNIKDYSLYRDTQLYKKSDQLRNKNSEYYKKNGIGISTMTRMIEILPPGEVLDIYGDFSDDFSNDFKI